MNQLVIESRNVDETRRIGRLLGEILAAGDVVSLVGPLGAGKTSLAQGLAAGLAVADRVTSPTFNLVNEYAGRCPVYHLDLYRLEGREDLADLGLEDYLAGDGVTVVEWGERFPGLLPDDHLEVIIGRGTDSGWRTIRFSPGGPRAAEIIEELRSRC